MIGVEITIALISTAQLVQNLMHAYHWVMVMGASTPQAYPAICC